MIGIPQSNLVLSLSVHDNWDMLSRDATATFREQRKVNGKKLYSEYVVHETMAMAKIIQGRALHCL